MTYTRADMRRACGTEVGECYGCLVDGITKTYSFISKATTNSICRHYQSYHIPPAVLKTIDEDEKVDIKEITYATGMEALSILQAREKAAAAAQLEAAHGGLGGLGQPLAPPEFTVLPPRPQAALDEEPVEAVVLASEGPRCLVGFMHENEPVVAVLDSSVHPPAGMTMVHQPPAPADVFVPSVDMVEALANVGAATAREALWRIPPS